MTHVVDDSRRREATRVGIVAKQHLHQAAALLDELASWLTARGLEPVFETHTAGLTDAGARYRACTREELAHGVDVVVVLGGDGTLLGMADRIAAAGRSIPVLGVNFGSLGFLTEVTLPELFPSIEAVVAGTAQIEERMMLRCRVVRGAVPVAEFLVLNEAVITRGPVSHIVDLSVWANDEFVARFKADGVIVATPTGSTAYNLSAGGPIVHPAVDAIVLTPIAPHTLTNRPVVIPASAEVRVQPLPQDDQPQQFFATFDGDNGLALVRDDVVRVRRAEAPLRLVRAATRSYFEVLRQKLKWAER